MEETLQKPFILDPFGNISNTICATVIYSKVHNLEKEQPSISIRISEC